MYYHSFPTIQTLPARENPSYWYGDVTVGEQYF
jgi:hypothetical protein